MIFLTVLSTAIVLAITTLIALRFSKRFYGALSESEARYRSLYDNSEVSIWNEDFSAVYRELERLRQDGVTNLRQYLNEHDKAALEISAMVNVFQVNNATLKLFGAGSEKEFLYNISDTFGPNTIEVFTDALCAIWERQERFRSEAQFRTLDGRILDCVVSWPIPRNEVDSGSIPVSIVDISERRQLAAERQESEERYKQLFDEMQNGFAHSEIICDAQGRPIDSLYLAVNPAFARITGRNQEDVVGKAILEIFPGLEPIWIERFGRVAQAGESMLFEQHAADLGMTFEVSAFCPAPNQWACTFADITERRRTEETNNRRAERVANQRNLIAELTFDENIVNGSVDDALHSVLSKLSAALQVERTSVWMLSEDQTALQRKGLYDTSTGFQTQIETLDTPGFPSYFAALRRDSQIDADDAQNDPRTKQLTDSYFDPLEITSMLDSAIQQDGKLIGVLSAEHRGPVREWQPDEKSFLSAITNLIAYIFASAERNEARRELQLLNTQLEVQVQQRTAQLESANEELQAFSYAVSHDLRAPLRAMGGFSGALMDDYADRLDDDARNYLTQIVLASQKMNEQITGLLTLSRATRTDVHCERIDVTAMAHNQLDMLIAPDPNRAVETEVEPGLVVYGDKRMIENLMENLLQNALKYSSNAAHALIRVHAGKLQGLPAICIQDNGAGFDMAHSGHLFEPFQRLHRQEEFPGLGIGLATVHRIIKRHGGTITAEGKPGEGARFCFALPQPTTEEDHEPS